jgi:hypothetical protein
VSSLADSTDDALPRRVRLLGTLVNPVVFALLAEDSEDPVGARALSKLDALRQLEARDPDIGAAARHYFELAAALFAKEPPIDAAEMRAAYRAGLEVLIAANRRGNRSGG